MRANSWRRTDLPIPTSSMRANAPATPLSDISQQTATGKGIEAITADQAAFEGSIDSPQAVYVDNDGSKVKTEMTDFVEAEEVENATTDNEQDNTNA